MTGTITYRGSANPITDNKLVFINSVDTTNLRAIGLESGLKGQYTIDLSKYIGTNALVPAIGEQWIITKLNNAWVLLRKTSLQSNATQVIQNSNPGTQILDSNQVHITGDLTVAGDLNAANVMPTGAYIPWAGPTNKVPAGWLLCDGSGYLINLYPNLYAVIGTIYGTNGTGTFKVPDLQRRIPVGYSSGDSDFGTVGGTAGNKTQPSAAHTHTLSDAGQAKMTITTGGLIVTRAVAISGNFAETNRYTMTGSNGTPSSSSGTGIGLAGSTDSATPAATSVLQPSITAFYIIKT